MPDRMLRTWVRLTDIAVSLATGTTFQPLLSDYEAEVGLTRVRGTIAAIYGDVMIKPQAILATGVSGRFGVGIGVFNVGASASTAPNPLDDSFPWLWAWEGFIHPVAQEVSADTFSFLPIYREVKVRSQRKMRLNEGLMVVFSNGMAAALNMTFAGRALLKQ